MPTTITLILLIVLNTIETCLVKSNVKKIKNIFLHFIFYFSIAFSFFVLLQWIDSPILDLHGFRQTQTAITSYYLIENNYNIINYQTPVLGYPWSLPFEFPLYQCLCSLLAQISKINLDVSGRLISWIFMLITLHPLYRACIYLKNKSVFYLIAILYLNSPLYLFWSRTFMIETCALCFGMYFTYYIIIYIDNQKTLHSALAFLSAVLCLLVKATTFPVFFIMGTIYYFRQTSDKDHYLLLKLISFGVLSLLITVLWIHHADSLKSLNPIGTFLTSKSLTTWNLGTIQQRLSSTLYSTIIFRMCKDILGSPYVLFVLISLYCLASTKTRRLIVTLLICFMIPMYLFPGLHIIHNYYQVANGIFLIIAVGVAIDDLYTLKPFLAIINLIGIIVIMKITFISSFMPIMNSCSSQKSDIWQISQYINHHTPIKSSLITIGYDWSSEIHYYSQRKGIAFPTWIKPTILEEFPTSSNDNLSLSAIVYRNTQTDRDQLQLLINLLNKHQMFTSQIDSHKTIFFSQKLITNDAIKNIGTYAFIPKDLVGRALNIESINNDASWSIAGAYGKPQDLFGALNYWGSWSGSDSLRGKISFTINMDNKKNCIVIPYLTGPVCKNQSLAIYDTGSNKKLCFLTSLPEAIDGWKHLLIKIPATITQIKIVASDNGADWGEWCAIGVPSSIK